jgi:copper/silver efflux system protein
VIARLIGWSARHRGLVIGIVTAIAAWGAWCLPKVPADAFPDLGETQVILYTRWDRSAELIEDQVTYPIVTAMLGAPKVKTVRGISDFGYSFVYVIFEDGTDPYWARARTQELLSGALTKLPSGVHTELGPDATGLGWIYQYALVDDRGTHTLAQLRTVQDYDLRFRLRAISGVAEVASVGGFVPQYQVVVDPARMRAFEVNWPEIVAAVRASNIETGGRIMEFGGSEYMIRGRGYLADPRQLADAVIGGTANSRPVRIKDVASVTVGPDMRRGIADLDGKETVSGIVIMRQGAHVEDVAREVRRTLTEAGQSLPPGVRVVPVYDRSEIIERVKSTWWLTLAEITLAVVAIVLMFLLDLESALVPIVMIPLTALVVAVPFHALGLTFNLMSLAGIAIAIGALVDASIVMVEQAHKELQEAGARRGVEEKTSVILRAVTATARPAFFALLVMGVAFLPVLALQGQQGRLFQPLAWAKSLTIFVAALLAITVTPALRMSLAGIGQRRTGSRRSRRFVDSLSRRLAGWYQPVLEYALRHPGRILALVLVAALATWPVWRQLESEMVPPLDEGALLYMPSTAPGISIAEASRLLRRVDSILAHQPEVAQVLGKAGRADTATDPAPLSMLETMVILKPREQWPEALSTRQLIDKLDHALQLPGVSNSWTMPIRGRIDMLETGVRSPLGLKISGLDSSIIASLASQAERILRDIPGARGVFAERSAEGRYIDIRWDRDALARAGLTMEQAQATVQQAIGGEEVSTIVDGRARYPVNVRLPRDARGNLDALRNIPVAGAQGTGFIPLSQLASVAVVTGPAMIRDENGLLTGYVYLDVGASDPARFVAHATTQLAARLPMPPGYSLAWSGQYEAYQRVMHRLWQIVPLTLALIAGLLYLYSRSWAKTGLVLLAVPFSAIGAIWSVHLLGYPMSPAVWVGTIALLGVDAETGIFMLLYLDIAWQTRTDEGRMRSADDLYAGILEGAAHRIRPKLMTVATMFIGLVPIFWANGAGSEVMKRIAAPMIGGLGSSFLMELLVFPILYSMWRGRDFSATSPATRQAKCTPLLPHCGPVSRGGSTIDPAPRAAN